MVPVHGRKISQPGNDGSRVQRRSSSQRTSSVSSLGSMDSRFSYVSNVTGYEAELCHLKQSLLTNGDETHTNDNVDWQAKCQLLEQHRQQLELQNYDLEMANQLLRTNETSSLALIEQLREQHLVETARIKGQLSYHLLELESKDTVNETLKGKITQQYCLVQARNAAIGSLKSRNNELVAELSAIRSAGEWYKNELHRCQQQKAEFNRRLLVQEQELCQENGKIKRLEHELRIAGRMGREIETTAMQEKSELLVKLQELQQNMQAPRDSVSSKSLAACVTCSLTQFTIDDLRQHVNSLQKTVETSQLHTSTVEERNAQLQANMAVVQTSLADKQVLIATLEDYIRRLEEERVSSEIQCRQLQTRITLLQDAHCQASAAVAHQIENLQKDLCSRDERVATVEQELRNTRDEVKKLEMDVVVSKENHEHICRSLMNDVTSLRVDLNAAATVGITKQNEIDKLRQQQRVQSAELLASQNLIEKYEQEKSHIEENITHLTQSSLSDRNKYELIKVEKEDLSSKLVMLNEQLHRIKLDHIETDAVVMSDISCQVNSGNDASVAEAELKHMKTLIKVLQKEHGEKIKRHELNVRTLLKKVTEHMRGRAIAEQRLKIAPTPSDLVDSLNEKLASIENAYACVQKELENVTEEKQKIMSFMQVPSQQFDNALDALIALSAEATQNAQTLQLLKASATDKDVALADLQLQIDQAQRDLHERQIQHDSLSIIAKDKVTECERLSKRLHSIRIELDNNRNLQSSTRALETALAILRMKLHRQIKENESLEISVRNFARSHERMQAELKSARQTAPSQIPSIRISLQNPLNDEKHPKDAIKRWRRFDLSKASRVLAENAKSSVVSLDPLEKCIRSLKIEMNALDVVVRENGQRRGALSLMEELSLCGHGGVGP